MYIISKIKDCYDHFAGIFGIDKNATFIRNEQTTYKLIDSYTNQPFITQYYALITGKKIYIFKLIYEVIIFDDYTIRAKYNLISSEIITSFEINKVPYFCTLILLYNHSNIKTYSNEEYIKLINNSKSSYISNNILIKSLPFKHLLDFKQIYLDIYTYLLSKKDINIIDNRTDIQKLESKGFDKKISFRNI